MVVPTRDLVKLNDLPFSEKWNFKYKFSFQLRNHLSLVLAITSFPCTTSAMEIIEEFSNLAESMKKILSYSFMELRTWKYFFDVSGRKDKVMVCFRNKYLNFSLPSSYSSSTDIGLLRRKPQPKTLIEKLEVD